MTTIPEALAALEAAKEPSRALSDMVLEAKGYLINKDGWWLPPDEVSHDNTWAEWRSLPRPHVTADLQACIDHVVPEGWRVFMERLPVDSGPCWTACVRPHGKDGADSDWKESAALALCIASLKAEGQADG